MQSKIETKEPKSYFLKSSESEELFVTAYGLNCICAYKKSNILYAYKILDIIYIILYANKNLVHKKNLLQEYQN